MKVEIRRVVDAGDLKRERLVLRTRAKVDIGDFMLVCTGLFEDEVTTDVKSSLWFPDKRIEARDLVVVYTKAGRDHEKALGEGRTAHFFYWGRKRPLWDADDVAPVLLHAPHWVTRTPSELSRPA